ncbi:MAG: hypothetical protein JEZ03_14350 [Bacteroidales bacterium]|nr:hypothetical protein [Bacteroidales bacterium]
MKINISLSQIQIELGNPQFNLETSIFQIVEANKRGSDVILFPELWTTGYELDNCENLAKENQFLSSKLKDLSSKFDITIGGSMIIAAQNQFYNEFRLFFPNGSIAAYRKIHLFGLMNEKKHFTAGESPIIINSPIGKIGLATCYDLRFPELFRVYGIEQVDMVFIVAEWPLKRIQHWDTLLKARAIENQFFVAAVNTIGIINNETFGGSSTIIDPWGETIVSGSKDKQELLSGQCDLEKVKSARSNISVFTDRQPEVYNGIMKINIY